MTNRDADQAGSSHDPRATGGGPGPGSAGSGEGPNGVARVPFGEALRYYRKQAGLTQTELAERAGLGITQAAVALAEKSNTPLRNKERINALARALNISPSALAVGLVPPGAFGGTGGPLPGENAGVGAAGQDYQLRASQAPYFVAEPLYRPESGQDLLGERLEELEKRLRDVERFLTAVQQSIATLEHLANSAQEVVTGTMSEIAQLRSDAFQLGSSSGQQIQPRSGTAGRGRGASRFGR